MRQYFYNHKHKTEFEKVPQKVVSLIPSVTETLFEIGAGRKIAGITDYCIFPKDKVKDVAKVGGPKSVNKDLIDKINPDLIFMDPEENTLDDFEELRREYPIFVINVRTVEDSVEFLRSIGELFELEQKAESFISRINRYLHDLRSKYKNAPARRILILIWKDPYYVPGSGTYITSLAETYGVVNVFADKTGYFRVEEEGIIGVSPDIILLPDEPYEFKDEDVSAFNRLFENSGAKPKIRIVSGANLCWYGVRTLEGLKYFDGVFSEI